MDNLPAKKAAKQVGFPDLAMLPQLFQAALPPIVPQLQYKPGIIAPLIEGMFHNWKLLHLQRSADREAGIAESHNRKMKAQFEMITDMVLFSRRLEFQMEDVKFQQKMLDIKQKKEEAELINLQLKNMQEQTELQIAQLDLKLRLKEARENGLIETEDSEG